MPKYQSKSEFETKSIAAKIAHSYKSNVFALYGQLGAGKTVFVQGFAKAFNIKDRIISPTFVLVRQHPIPQSKQVLYHIDLYRLTNIKDIDELSLKEIISCKDNIVLIEWAEKIHMFLPKDTVKISIIKTGQDNRLIAIEV